MSAARLSWWKKRRLVLVVILLLLKARTAVLAEVDPARLPPPAPVQVSFPTHIQPLLERSCIRCHGSERPKGKFSLVNRDFALKGGSSGPAILPGDSANSP